jgi:hypothetical protein
MSSNIDASASIEAGASVAPLRTDDPASPHYDPRPWRVLESLQAVPLSAPVRAAIRRSHESRCRRIAFPLIRSLALVLIALGTALRWVLPARAKSYRALHACVISSLHLFALPETRWLILRHFDLGSRILEFLVANSGHPALPNKPQHPRTLFDLWPNAFMEHDVNLYRVLQGLGQHGAPKGSTPAPNFTAIVEPDLQLDSVGPCRWWHFLDLQSAIELLVPLYVIFLPPHETFRASHSLQLDEVVALHLAQLKGDASALVFLRNHSPWLPLSLWGTGNRLLNHGLSTEVAYEMLLRWKRGMD